MRTTTAVCLSAESPSEFSTGTILCATAASPRGLGTGSTLSQVSDQGQRRYC
jgi:hypothetical protein